MFTLFNDNFTIKGVYHRGEISRKVLKMMFANLGRAGAMENNYGKIKNRILDVLSS